MPKRVRRMQQSPVIAPASRCECVEGRRHHRGPRSGWRHRNPLFAPGSPRLRTPEPAPRRSLRAQGPLPLGALGGAILHSGHYKAGTEAHPLEADISESRVLPVLLDIALSVLAGEAL